ncbi:MAG: penicillin-binding transpeptidase domain-containing protein [Gemmatimonadota bacterium]|nr:penicillin-binding transpeptidase domain-containing protein [Gemmatimonadota bacterium]
MKKRARRDTSHQWVGRRRILLGALGAAGLLVLGRSFQLQALEGEKWARYAAEQQQTRAPLPARRGAIYDRDGVPLALTAESFSIAVAPRELRDPRATAARLTRALGLPPSLARRATDRRRRWVVLPGRFSAVQRERLAGIRGIHFERKLDRVYPQSELAREVLGLVSRDGRPLGGIEQEMDSVLRGRAGWSVLRRDARGQALPAGSLPVVPPIDGADVYLSIDLDLQEIAEVALGHAIDSTGASGGDLLLADPRTGELLAAVSRRPGGARGLAAFSETYEPGSTLKPFFVAALLARGKVSLRETVHAEDGEWRAPGGRLIRDVSPHGALSVADALRVSSNIGLVKLSPRLEPREQFGALRDLGFGAPTGVEYPAEAAGRLARPQRWSSLTPGSLAMGYEVSVTPLQMLMAYGALANGGTLFEPSLVREVRDVDGTIRGQTRPRPVRRAIPTAVAEQLREVLISVVEGGTAMRASLTTFEVAGKTGTSRRTGAGGRYVPGSYTSSFVGFFPARQPQLALFVKLDDPRGAYTGGLTAAPVTRETLQAILAARGSPTLDAQHLLASRLVSAVPEAPQEAHGLHSGSDGRYVFILAQGPSESVAAPLADPVTVPELAGLPLRDAVRRSHELGLRVRIQGSGAVQTTTPAAGSRIRRGHVLLLIGGS